MNVDTQKKRKRLDVDKVLKQRAKNPLMSLSDQAKLNGVSKQALSQLFQRHGVDINTVEMYKETRADLFAGKQEMVLGLLDEVALKRMVEKAPMAAITFFNSLFNNERLERGLSTQNSAVILASAVIQAHTTPQDIVVEPSDNSEKLSTKRKDTGND